MTNHGRFAHVIAAIDNANAHDPHMVQIDGGAVPAELLYGRRMSDALARMASNAGSTSNAGRRRAPAIRRVAPAI
jgi:hypothetical protein